jgi:aconitate hydratase
LPYRSNVPRLSDFCFTVCDPDFPARAREKGEGIIVGGQNYGQGSSREHAALVPLYLGVRAVVAKSFARIHRANLINFGIVPMTFKNAEDYDLLALGDGIVIDGLADAIKDGRDPLLTVKGRNIEIPLSLELSERQRRILSAGGLLEYTRRGEG